MISPSSRQPVHPGTFYGGIVCAGAGAASTIMSGRTLRGLPGSRSQRDLAGRSDEIYIAEMDFGLRRRAAPAINESPNQ
jgi:hypothetical protein